MGKGNDKGFEVGDGNGIVDGDDTGNDDSRDGCSGSSYGDVGTGTGITGPMDD